MVGIDNDTTGPTSFLGKAEVAAAKAAFNAVNAKGGINGHKIEVKVLDNGGQLQTTLLDAKRLISEGAKVIMVGVTQNQDKLVQGLVGSGGPLFVDFGNGYKPTLPSHTFDPTPSDFASIDVLVAWLNTHGYHRIGLLASTDTTGEIENAELETALGKVPGHAMHIVGLARFDPTATNLTPQIQRLLADGSQAIMFTASAGNEGPVFVRDEVNDGLKMPVTLDWAYSSLAFLHDVSGIGATNVYVAMEKALVPQLLGTSGAKYRAAAEKLHKLLPGQVIDQGDLLGYDPAEIAIYALEHGGLSATAETRALQNLDGFTGTLGTYSFSATNHNGTPAGGFVTTRIDKNRYVAAG